MNDANCTLLIKDMHAGMPMELETYTFHLEKLTGSSVLHMQSKTAVLLLSPLQPPCRREMPHGLLMGVVTWV